MLNRGQVIFTLMVWPAALNCRRRGWRHLAMATPVIFFLLSTQMDSQSATVGAGLALVAFALAGVSTRLPRALSAVALVIAFLGAPMIAPVLYKAGLSEAPWLQSSAYGIWQSWYVCAMIFAALSIVLADRPEPTAAG